MAHGRAVALGNADVVLERVVRGVERVLELVALEEVVAGARLVARAMLGIDGATDRPDAALLALDPDHDPLGRATVVDTVDNPLREPSGLLLSGQRIKDTIASVGAISRFFRGIFSFVGARSSEGDRIAAYVIREHDRGRTVADILDDPYVRNRCSPAELERLLDRPDLIEAIGNDMAEAREAVSGTG
jgi:uncharacterized protein (DUF2126 family)